MRPSDRGEHRALTASVERHSSRSGPTRSASGRRRRARARAHARPPRSGCAPAGTRRMAAMCTFTVPSVSPSWRAMSLFGSPFSSSRSTSSCRGVRPDESMRRRWLAVLEIAERSRRNVDTARAHRPQRLEQQRRRIALRDEAVDAGRERAANRRRVVLARGDDRRPARETARAGDAGRRARSSPACSDPRAADRAPAALTCSTSVG